MNTSAIIAIVIASIVVVTISIVIPVSLSNSKHINDPDTVTTDPDTGTIDAGDGTTNPDTGTGTTNPDDNGEILKFLITIEGIGLCPIKLDGWKDHTEAGGSVDEVQIARDDPVTALSSIDNHTYAGFLSTTDSSMIEQLQTWYLDSIGHLYTIAPDDDKNVYLGKTVGMMGTYDQLVDNVDDALVLDRKSIIEQKYDPKLIPIRAGGLLWPGPSDLATGGSIDGQFVASNCSGFYLYFNDHVSTP
jgi:hypothetical protein